MVPDLETAQRLCVISTSEANLLQSRSRPIVLLQKRPDCGVTPEVAPGNAFLGVMLPYTPLHVLILQAFSEWIGLEQPAVLVMTSGNVSDEPIAYRDEDALTRLAPIAEGWLTHNRPIHIRCDDSVVRIVAGGEQILRRSRGFVPQPIRLQQHFPVPVL